MPYWRKVLMWKEEYIMKKCCFIIPYFGKLPNYFPVFLKSCKENLEFNWLLLTDDKSSYDYPPNFEVIYINFEELKKKFNQSLILKYL